MNAVVDAGNTLTKVGIFERDSLKIRKEFHSAGELQSFLHKTLIENLIVSSVMGNEAEIVGGSLARHSIILQQDTPLPIQNRYSTPSSLGSDRIAAACGVWLLYPHQDCLAIDLGTCINYEFVNKEGEYLGGAISPGVKMRFNAMHHFTEKLPVAKPASQALLIGDSTVSCLQSGVMNGVLEEINGILLRYRMEHPDLRVILCGGDAHFFENYLKPPIFVAPELILIGLNSILLHNVTS